MPEITHIRVSSPGTHESQIIRLKLADGSEKSRADVIQDIEGGSEYFYRIGDGTRIAIEVVHPLGENSYIRSKASDSSESRSLLHLPEF